jgi:hypothetical protein
MGSGKTFPVLLVGALCLIAPCVAAQPFSFAAIGDTGYSKSSEQELDRLIADLNKEKLSFVVHVGDFEADPRPYLRDPEKISKPCTDEHYARVRAQFQASAHPFIFTPGDNDWTDCHLLKLDPLERLAALRQMFYPQGQTLGKRQLKTISQSQQGQPKFRENLYWALNKVSFATLHIVGSNDNKGRTPDMDAEAAERTAANIAWLRNAFAQARQTSALGLVLMTQANPGFETHWTPSLIDRYFRLFPGVNPPKQLPPSGFDEILTALESEMQTFERPVLFIHGDTHIFHVSKPLVNKKTQRFYSHFTRLEVFGDPDSHWVQVSVDPKKKELFTVEPRIVAGNRPK